MDSTYLPIARLDDLVEDVPAHAAADGIDLVLVRRGGHVHVFEGRCPHRGALLADGRVEGANLICGVHGWDYRLDTGVSAYNPAERIYKFACHVQDGEVLVDKADLVEYRNMRRAHLTHRSSARTTPRAVLSEIRSHPSSPPT